MVTKRAGAVGANHNNASKHSHTANSHLPLKNISFMVWRIHLARDAGLTSGWVAAYVPLRRIMRLFAARIAHLSRRARARGCFGCGIAKQHLAPAARRGIASALRIVFLACATRSTLRGTASLLSLVV